MPQKRYFIYYSTKPGPRTDRKFLTIVMADSRKGALQKAATDLNRKRAKDVFVMSQSEVDKARGYKAPAYFRGR